MTTWPSFSPWKEGHGSYGGIRYLSQLDSSWECWAVFDNVELDEIERQSILPGDDDLGRVASRCGLRVF